MRTVCLRWIFVPGLVLFILANSFFPALAQEPVVRAVLFYSPSCPHCHTVITEDLPPLLEEYGGTPVIYMTDLEEGREDYGPPLVGIYGDQIEILYVNTMTTMGSSLYTAMADQFELPAEQRGVPAMVVGTTLMIGGFDIPERFPTLIEQGLQGDGYDWPDIEGLSSAMAGLKPAPTEEAAQATATTEEDEPTQSSSVAPTETENNNPGPGVVDPPVTVNPGPTTQLGVMQRIQLDPLGNSISIAVLIGMLLTVGAVILRSQMTSSGFQQRLSWAYPFLILVGMGVAAYLAYIETTGNLAICGPVGDCNTVQQSEYASLFGIPIAVLGLLGYLAALGGWLVVRFADKPWSDWAKLALLAITSFGTLFSIYLTFLEPFVIGATCAWCLTSAVIMTVLFWFSAEPGLAAWERLAS